MVADDEGAAGEPAKRRYAPHPPGEWRVLVVANETVGGAELLAELSAACAGGRKTEVLVVVARR